MNRKRLVTGITLACLLIVGFVVMWFHTPSCDCGISHGTVVIASVDKDSIVIAADSRETEIAFREKRVTHTDTAHKIFRIGNTFFAVAGLSELCNMSTREFVARNYDTTKSIKENAPVIEDKLKKALQTELDGYSKKQKGYLAGHDYSVELFISGYEKGMPIFGHVDAGVKFVTLFKNPVESFSGVSTGGNMPFDVAGIHDHIYEVKINFNSNKLQTMRRLIALEARHHNDVDSLVQYAIIKKDGYRVSFGRSR
ncbi:MAG: hypothetical protein JSU01_09035 [Bacteroidetes bacterium]|nr:hypothetical protein [Bacteroidota bacterium]